MMIYSRTLLAAITLALTLGACGKSDKTAEPAPTTMTPAAAPADPAAAAAPAAATPEDAEKKKAEEAAAAAPK